MKKTNSNKSTKLESVSVDISHHTLPLSRDIGHKYLDNSIYSIGKDFTSDSVNTPGCEGRSSLKKIWSGKKPGNMDDADKITLIDIKVDDEIVGVLAWVKPTDTMMRGMEIDNIPSHPRHFSKETMPTSHLGMFMCFLKKEHRGKGLIRQALIDHLNPLLLEQANIAKKNGNLPIILGVDASETLLRSCTSIPVVARQEAKKSPSIGFRQEVWLLYRDFLFYDNLSLKEWMVYPKSLSKMSVKLKNHRNKNDTEKDTKRRSGYDFF